MKIFTTRLFAAAGWAAHVGAAAATTGARVAAPCYLRDLFPTVCEITGTPVPPSVQGRSLLPAMRGGAGEAAIFGRFTDTQRMMRTADGWKVI